MKKTIERELKNEAVCINSWGTEHSKGVSCIVRTNNKLSIVSKHMDNDGRLVLLNVKLNGDIYTIVNIYAPNNDGERNTFFKKIANSIEQHGESYHNCIIGGDFNYAPNNTLDRNLEERKNSKHYDKCTSGYRKLCTCFDLHDIWRYTHTHPPQLKMKILMNT